MNTKAKFIIMGSMITLLSCGHNATKLSVKEYPETRKDATVVDEYFGTKVADPYRWLENDTTAETAQWVDAQRAVTEDYLSQIPFREALKQRMTELVNYERFSLPSKRFNRYIFSKNDGLQNQNVIYIQNSLEEEPSVLLDPNTLSDDDHNMPRASLSARDSHHLGYTPRYLYQPLARPPMPPWEMANRADRY